MPVSVCIRVRPCFSGVVLYLFTKTWLAVRLQVSHHVFIREGAVESLPNLHVTHVSFIPYCFCSCAWYLFACIWNTCKAVHVWLNGWDGDKQIYCCSMTHWLKSAFYGAAISSQDGSVCPVSVEVNPQVFSSVPIPLFPFSAHLCALHYFFSPVTW